MAIQNKTDLLALVNTNITTNGANGITGAELNTILTNLVDSGFNSIDDVHKLFRTYDPTKSYTVGLPCIYSGSIYQCNTATSGAFNAAHWTLLVGGSGSTNLAYTASPTNGVVTSDTGTDATLPLGDVTNAGLISPAQTAAITANTAKVSASGSIDTHSDVDTSTVAPTTDQVLKWNGTSWVPGTTAGVAGGLVPQGTWNASTNTPTLTSGTGTVGYYYRVSVDGSTNLDGITDWKVGDHLFFAENNAWNKIDNTDAVATVNGQTGTVVLTTSHIAEGTNLYYTDVRVAANSAVTANTAKVSASGSINTHSDVDTVTVAPVTNDGLVWNGTNFVPVQVWKKSVFASITYGAGITWDYATGYNKTVTLTGNTSLTLTNFTFGDTGTLIVTQDATGGRTITFPAGSAYVRGTDPAAMLNTAANAVTILRFTSQGSNIWWEEMHTLPLGQKPYTTLTYGATTTVNCSTSNNAKVTLTGNTTLAITGARNGMSGEIIVIQNATGGWVISALPATSKIVEGTTVANLISTAANDTTILSWRFDGTTYFWDYGKNFA